MTGKSNNEQNHRFSIIHYNIKIVKNEQNSRKKFSNNVAFVPVPKYLTKVKTKVALNLTKRQIVCFSLGALVGVPTYIFTCGAIGNESAVLLMIGLMLPFFFFAMYEKDGMPLEKVLKNFINATFLHPQTRPYQTDNIYAALERQNEYDKEVATKQQIKQEIKQEKSLQAAKQQLEQEKAAFKSINLFPDSKLSRSEKRRLTAAVKKAKRDGRIAKTAQQTIPYKEMLRDGICMVNDHFFTKQIFESYS